MRVVITGASRGIGAALAERYRARGDAVIGTARSAAAQVSLDVTQPSSFAGLTEALGTGGVDLLVCNAGVYLDKGESIETGYGADLWAKTFAANVTGVFQTVQTALPNLRASQGKIAIISSQMGSSTRAKGTSLIYRTSKAAVLNLGFNLANGLRGDGIAVGIYHPGWVRTDMGGSDADISVEDSADGLVARFDALSLETTGCFETWDGRPHAH
ncbi:MAG: SDR family NAD(P)-dependent oxidoreductase [Pseudomonadota bacterium]